MSVISPAAKTSKSGYLLLLTVVFLLLISLASAVYARDQDNHSALPQTQESNGSPEKVSLQLKWFHQFQFAGYYAAKIKGFYAEEGLDVTIKERDIYTNNIEQVINGESEYGIADSMLMLYQAKGAPLTIVSAIFQHSPLVFLTLKSSGIDSPYELKDKTVAFYQKDTDGFPLLAMLHENNIDIHTNRMVIKEGPEVLASGQVDVYPGYLSNEPYFFIEKGIDINVIRPLNFGVDFYGDLIFANNDEVNNHPDRVESFRRASIRGWQYALENKAEIINYIIKELKVDKSFEHLMYEAKAIEEIIQAGAVPIGTLNAGRLKYIQKLFEKHKLINKEYNLSEGIYKPELHKLKLSRVEKAWIKRNPQVTVAIDPSWQPIEFIDEHDRYNGLVKDYLNHLNAITGIKFLPQKQLTWNQSVEAVKSGRIDMFSAVIETPDRRQYVNFTPAYLKFPMVIATQKGENYIPDFNKLPKKVIAVVENYAAHELLEKNYPHLDTLLVHSIEEGLNAVATGQAYGYVDNLAVVGYHIRSLGLTNIQISGETAFNANIKMAVGKELPELHSILTKALATIDNETKTRLSNRWLQIEYKQEINWKELALYLAPALLILLLVSIYGHKMRTLNRQLTTTNQKLVTTQKSLEASNERLEILSVTDFLTGAYNRQHLDQVLEGEISRSQRYHSKLSVLLIDLDNFKQINDNYGHLLGDEVIKRTFNVISENVRKSDTVGRWGGEEFIVICPETDLEHARQLAEKLLNSVAELKFIENFTQTISIGIAQSQPSDHSISLIDRADKQLYKAKRQGKNRVCA